MCYGKTVVHSVIVQLRCKIAWFPYVTAFIDCLFSLKDCLYRRSRHSVAVRLSPKEPSRSAQRSDKSSIELLMMWDPYNVLGVPRSVTPEMLGDAYRKCCLETHPDKQPKDTWTQLQANAKFDNVQRAYRHICLDMKRHDKGSRLSYYVIRYLLARIARC